MCAAVTTVLRGIFLTLKLIFRKKSQKLQNRKAGKKKANKTRSKQKKII